MVSCLLWTSGLLKAWYHGGTAVLEAKTGPGPSCRLGLELACHVHFILLVF